VRVDDQCGDAKDWNPFILRRQGHHKLLKAFINNAPKHS
jgi:hypothetical protein